MKRLSRVLCAVAIDDRDRSVFEHALALARRHDAKMLLLNAVSPQVSFNRGATERVEFLRRLRSLAEAAGVDIRVTVQTGPVDEIILLHARARQVDLIVMGTARNHESRRGLSGWIAERVLRDAPCPTLVLPRVSESPKTLADGILCAVDFSPASQAAVQEAVRMSEHGTRPVKLMHVVNGPDHRGLGADALNKLRDLIPPPERGAVVARVAVGRPVTELLQAAETMKAGLLVIGAASRTRIGSRLFGKTGQLLRDATCPVLAVPVPVPTQADRNDVARLAA